jgi:hypothetical protein
VTGPEQFTAVFPARPEFVPAVRRYVRAVMDNSPRTSDGELIGAELAGCALRNARAECSR